MDTAIASLAAATNNSDLDALVGNHVLSAMLYALTVSQDAISTDHIILVLPIFLDKREHLNLKAAACKEWLDYFHNQDIELQRDLSCIDITLDYFNTWIDKGKVWSLTAGFWVLCLTTTHRAKL
jgi:hypothetical protein